MKIILFFFFTALLSNTQLRAQDYQKDQERMAVKKIAELVNKHYVFAEEGARISKKFMDAFNNGAYKQISSWRQFDSTTTALLQSISGDGHMYTGVDAKVVRQLRGFSIDEPKADTGRIMINPAKINSGFQEVSIVGPNIGYIKLTTIKIDKQTVQLLNAAMTLVKDTRALILDLRNNGGGGSDIGSVLESCFLPPGIPLLAFHSRTGETVIDSTVQVDSACRYTKPLYVLINKGSASAAEAIAFALQQKKRAVIVGQPSAGAANMNTWYPVNDFLYVSVSTASPTILGGRESWQGKGVQPDIRTTGGEEITAVFSHFQKQKAKR